ncbi:MAG: hypothetical protein ACHQAY_18320 [Hyphomicrobiales bacterium]
MNGGWVVHYLDGKGQDRVSMILATETGALEWACSLAKQGSRVKFIEAPTSERIEWPEIESFCKDL